MDDITKKEDDLIRTVGLDKGSPLTGIPPMSNICNK